MRLCKSQGEAMPILQLKLNRSEVQSLLGDACGNGPDRIALASGDHLRRDARPLEGTRALGTRCPELDYMAIGFFLSLARIRNISRVRPSFLSKILLASDDCLERSCSDHSSIFSGKTVARSRIAPQ